MTRGGNAGGRGAAAILVATAWLATGTLACGDRGAEGSAAGAPSPSALATGGCLGPFCLGQPEPNTICRRLERADVSLFTDPADAGRHVTGILATEMHRCGDDPVLIPGTTADIVDCRGVRLGDAAAFVAKMHRQAQPIDPADDLWPDAPPGLRGLADSCTPGDPGASRTTLYLKDDRVVGIAIGRR